MSSTSSKASPKASEPQSPRLRPSKTQPVQPARPTDRFDWVALEPKLNSYISKAFQQLQDSAGEQSQSLQQCALQIQRLEEQLTLVKEVVFYPKKQKSKRNIFSVCLDEVAQLRQDLRKHESF